jgi:predicted RNA-binding protein Jag
MKEWIGTANTVDRAVDRGLASLNLSRDQVDVKILDEESSGLLSMFGYHRVKVRVQEKVRRVDRGGRFDWDNGDDRPERFADRRSGPRGQKEDRDETDRPAPQRPDRNRPDSKHPKTKEPRPHPPAKDRARPTKGRPTPATTPSLPKPKTKTDLVSRTPRVVEPIDPEVLMTQWKGSLGLDDLTWTMQPKIDHRIPIELKTSWGDRLAANGGKPLESFEYLFNLVSSGGDREKPWVTFHLQGFASTDETRVVDKAVFAAFQVRRTGKDFHLEPMAPGQRRAVHQALAHHPDVATSSEGEGSARHVVVKPKIKNPS